MRYPTQDRQGKNLNLIIEDYFAFPNFFLLGPFGGPHRFRVIARRTCNVAVANKCQPRAVCVGWILFAILLSRR